MCKKKTMHLVKKLPVSELNEHLICKICKGYIIDATTIIECLHTFCRSCIVKYLESNKYCPVCDVQVHKHKPLLNLRPDKIIQDLVYKLVPKLYQNELQRRNEFYQSHQEAKPSSFEEQTASTYQYILAPDETINLKIGYYGCRGATTRYLRCPAAVSVIHLQKLIKAKYDLTNNHHVDILYNQDCLNSTLTLQDVAYIYLWNKKEPLELTYRIYEHTAKRPKIDQTSKTDADKERNQANNNNNNWKEVQLRISENGEMSITGIQDDLVQLMDTNFTAPEVVKVVETKNSRVSKKKEMPELKSIKSSVGVTVVSSADVSSASVSSSVASRTVNSAVLSATAPNVVVTSGAFLSKAVMNVAVVSSTIDILPSVVVTSNNVIGANLNSATTTTVFSTINSTKCSVTCEEPVRTNDVKPVREKPVITILNNIEIKSKTSNAKETIINNGTDKGVKRKLEEPIILNHSIGIQHLSNNHPLKRYSTHTSSKIKKIDSEEVKKSEDKVDLKANENNKNCPVKVSENNSKLPPLTLIEKKRETADKMEVVVKENSVSVSTSSKSADVSSKTINVAPSKVETQLASPKVGNKFLMPNQPCYMPKIPYTPIINVPKLTPSTSTMKNDVRCTTSTTPAKSDVKLSAPTTVSTSNNITNHKVHSKAKSSNPIGYKTLRDPPKSWNSQISKVNVSKSIPDPKLTDLKNARPAKFFKMRNNMPRYLGNPASGVKPMYSVPSSPDKDKPPDKSEIKKHSIVKIDPKTLKPISEKAPETTSLSNQSDLKINTSSVSIFNPLKLQSSPKSERRSPKNERRSPKSPNSPKTKSISPPTKRDKLNLNFTPSNPFIPNLTSPTVSPNQFLCSSGPPGFPPYDPRVMAAYHTLLYGQRMAFPSPPLPFLNLDVGQRKNFDMGPPTSPKLGASSPQGIMSPQTPKIQQNSAIPQSVTTAKQTSLTSTTLSSKCPSTQPKLLNPTITMPKQPSIVTKKTQKEHNKGEKSLQNAVEKLTQSRTKEVLHNDPGKHNDSNSFESRGFNDIASKNQKQISKEVQSNKQNPKRIFNEQVARGKIVDCIQDASSNKLDVHATVASPNLESPTSKKSLEGIGLKKDENASAGKCPKYRSEIVPKKEVDERPNTKEDMLCNKAEEPKTSTPVPKQTRADEIRTENNIGTTENQLAKMVQKNTETSSSGNSEVKQHSSNKGDQTSCVENRLVEDASIKKVDAKRVEPTGKELKDEPTGKELKGAESSSLPKSDSVSNGTISDKTVVKVAQTEAKDNNMKADSEKVEVKSN